MGFQRGANKKTRGKEVCSEEYRTALCAYPSTTASKLGAQLRDLQPLPPHSSKSRLGWSGCVPRQISGAIPGIPPPSFLSEQQQRGKRRPGAWRSGRVAHRRLDPHLRGQSRLRGLCCGSFSPRLRKKPKENHHVVIWCWRGRRFNLNKKPQTEGCATFHLESRARGLEGCEKRHS